jgi:hypothetical protein
LQLGKNLGPTLVSEQRREPEDMGNEPLVFVQARS